MAVYGLRFRVSSVDTGLLIPDWIPTEELGRLDLRELAILDATLRHDCETLAGLLSANVAAYRAGAVARKTGLCSVFKFAQLTRDQAAMLAAAEARRPGIILVAYARPLERW